MKKIKDKIINKLLAPKPNSEQLNISDLIAESKRLIVFFPEEISDFRLLFEYLQSWETTFKELIFYIPDFSYRFVNHIEISGNISIRELNDEIENPKDSIVFNFSDAYFVAKLLNKAKGCLIIDKSGGSGINFIPKPESNIDILLKFADFFNYKIKKKKLNFLGTKKLNNDFFDNKFKHFTLYLKKANNPRFAEEIVRTLKQKFSANFYLYDMKFKSDEYPNLKRIEKQDLLYFWEFAGASDVFLTDDSEIAGLFNEVSNRCVFLGTEQIENTRSVAIKDVFELKNIVSDILGEAPHPK